jgi:hypothetical protein
MGRRFKSVLDKERVIKALSDFTKNRICLPYLIPWTEIDNAVALLKEQDELLNLQHEALRGSSDTISYLFHKIKSMTDGETAD